MTDQVTGHVVGRFPDRAGSENALRIEPDPGNYAIGDIHLLISPPGKATSIAVDVGAYRLGSTKPIPVPAGVVMFSGSNTAALPRAPLDDVQFRLLFAFDAKTGQPISPAVARRGAQLVATSEFHGAVAYQAYTTLAQELIYTPLFEGLRTVYGVVCAFAQPSDLVIYPVPLLELSSGQEDIELYRIISYAVTTPDGAFQMPPQYPTNGNYPGKSFVLNLDTHLRTKRVHEIGRMRPDGFAYVTTYHVAKLEPYVGDLSYTIPKVFEEGNLEGAYPSEIVLRAKNYIASRKKGVI